LRADHRVRLKPDAPYEQKGRLPRRSRRSGRVELERDCLSVSLAETDPLSVPADRLEVLGIVPHPFFHVVDRGCEILAGRETANLVLAFLIGTGRAHEAGILRPLVR